MCFEHAPVLFAMKLGWAVEIPLKKLWFWWCVLSRLILPFSDPLNEHFVGKIRGRFQLGGADPSTVVS